MTRLWEHVDTWVSGRLGPFAYTDHLIDHNFTLTRGSGEFINLETSYRRRIALEEIEHSCMNGVILLSGIQHERSHTFLLFRTAV